MRLRKILFAVFLFASVSAAAPVNVNVLDAKVCHKFEAGDPEMASDHLPVYVELELL